MPSGTSSSCAISLSRLRSIRAGDLAADAAAARGVGHQHRIAAGEREIGGERRALGAALLLDDLHQHHLPALDHLLNLVLPPHAAACARALPPSRRRRRPIRPISSSRRAVAVDLGDVVVAACHAQRRRSRDSPRPRRRAIRRRRCSSSLPGMGSAAALDAIRSTRSACRRRGRARRPVDRLLGGRRAGGSPPGRPAARMSPFVARQSGPRRSSRPRRHRRPRGAIVPAAAAMAAIRHAGLAMRISRCAPSPVVSSRCPLSPWASIGALLISSRDRSRATLAVRRGVRRGGRPRPRRRAAARSSSSISACRSATGI